MTGTHRLTADLCAVHGRVAVDRPRLVRDWLLQEGGDRAAAGLAPIITGPLAGARPPPQEAADLVVQVAAELASVAVVRTELSRLLARQGWGDELDALVALAVGEAVVNAIEHGSAAGGELRVAITVTPDRAAIVVADDGRLGASVPLGPPVAPSDSDPRSRGRLIMAGLAQRVEVRSDGHGTRVELQFARPPPVR